MVTHIFMPLLPNLAKTTGREITGWVREGVAALAAQTSWVFAFIKRVKSCLSLRIFSLGGVKVRGGALWVSAAGTFTGSHTNFVFQI